MITEASVEAEPWLDNRTFDISKIIDGVFCFFSAMASHDRRVDQCIVIYSISIVLNPNCLQ